MARVALEVQLGLRGVKISHSRRYHLQTCGKVERFHQTQKKWLAAQPCAATLAGLQHQLDRFGRYDNTIRPHRALGRRTPAQAYAARPKAIPTGAGEVEPEPGRSISASWVRIERRGAAALAASTQEKR